MKHDTNLHDDDFFERAAETQKRMAYIGFAAMTFFILLLSTILYFILAAAGIVPPLDLIPVVPHV